MGFYLYSQKERKKNLSACSVPHADVCFACILTHHPAAAHETKGAACPDLGEAARHAWDLPARCPDLGRKWQKLVRQTWVRRFSPYEARLGYGLPISGVFLFCCFLCLTGGCTRPVCMQPQRICNPAKGRGATCVFLSICASSTQPYATRQPKEEEGELEVELDRGSMS